MLLFSVSEIKFYFTFFNICFNFRILWYVMIPTFSFHFKYNFYVNLSIIDFLIMKKRDTNRLQKVFTRNASSNWCIISGVWILTNSDASCICMRNDSQKDQTLSSCFSSSLVSWRYDIRITWNEISRQLTLF